MKQATLERYDALDLLRQDHAVLQDLFERLEQTQDEGEQRRLCAELVQRLTLHTELEEAVVYPYMRDTFDDMEAVEEADLEHKTATELLKKLQREQPGTPRFEATVKVLGEYVAHHIHEEENRLFPLMRATGVDLEAMGLELAERSGARVEDGSDADDSSAPRRQSSQAKSRGKSSGQQRSRAAGDSSKQAASERGSKHPAAREVAHEPMQKTAQETENVNTARQDAAFLKEHGDDLSRSTQRAKWIHAVDEHEDHPGQTLATRNHAVIRQWVESRGGQPVTSQSNDPENPRVLRFSFTDDSKSLQPIEWEAWFSTFDDRELVFIYQEHQKAGNPSNFFRLDSPYREDG